MQEAGATPLPTSVLLPTLTAILDPSMVETARLNGKDQDRLRNSISLLENVLLILQHITRPGCEEVGVFPDDAMRRVLSLIQDAAKGREGMEFVYLNCRSILEYH